MEGEAQKPQPSVRLEQPTFGSRGECAIHSTTTPLSSHWMSAPMIWAPISGRVFQHQFEMTFLSPEKLEMKNKFFFIFPGRILWKNSVPILMAASHRLIKNIS